MKRLFNFIYFVGISLLLFFCLLSIGKGFYLEGFIRTPVVAFCIGLWAIGTLIVIALSDSVDITKKDEEDPIKENPTVLQVGNCKIDNKLIQKTLTDIIYHEDENVKVNYDFYGNVVDITVDVKRFENIKVADVINGIEKELNVQLSEMFNISNELDIRFTVNEVDAPAEEEKENEIVEETENSTAVVEQTQEDKESNSTSDTKDNEA